MKSTLGLDIEGAVEVLLRQDATVRSILYGALSANATTQGWRLYPDLIMQGSAMPAVAFLEVSDTAVMNTDGPGLETSRIQIDVYSGRRVEALYVLSVIDRVLCPRQSVGEVGMSRIVRVGDEVINVQGVFPDVRRSGYEQATKLYRRSRDYHVTASSV